MTPCQPTEEETDSIAQMEESSTKVLQQSEFRDETGDRSTSRRRNKVDKLGEVLKRRVTMLRRRESQMIDLVFLVDSSASVGSQNFANEIKFVRKVCNSSFYQHHMATSDVIADEQ